MWATSVKLRQHKTALVLQQAVQISIRRPLTFRLNFIQISFARMPTALEAPRFLQPPPRPMHVEDDLESDEDDLSNMDYLEGEAQYRAYRILDARKYIGTLKGLSDKDSAAFVKEHCCWSVEHVVWDEDGQARSADLTCPFSMPGASSPLTVSMSYHYRVRWSSVEWHTCLKWSRGNTGTDKIFQSKSFKLKAAELKSVCQECFGEGWTPLEVMTFIYLCIGIPFDTRSWNMPLANIEMKSGWLDTHTNKVCKQAAGSGGGKAAGKRGSTSASKAAAKGVTKTKGTAKSTAVKKKKTSASGTVADDVF
jgi:hypothetical protein